MLTGLLVIPKTDCWQLLATESTISGQLKKLLEIGYVLRSEAGRESRYELAEPLMRLASEVKEQQRRPLQLLVSFLRVWYRPEALPELMHRAGTDSLRRHIAEAMIASRSSPTRRTAHFWSNAVAENSCRESRTKMLDTLEEKAVTTSSAKDWYEFAYAQSDNPRFLRSALAGDRALALCSADP